MNSDIKDILIQRAIQSALAVKTHSCSTMCTYIYKYNHSYGKKDDLEGMCDGCSATTNLIRCKLDLGSFVYVYYLCDTCFAWMRAIQHEMLTSAFVNRRIMLLSQRFNVYTLNNSICIACCINEPHRVAVYGTDIRSFICGECKIEGTTAMCINVLLLLGQLIIADVCNKIALMIWRVNISHRR